MAHSVEHVAPDGRHAIVQTASRAQSIEHGSARHCTSQSERDSHSTSQPNVHSNSHVSPAAQVHGPAVSQPFVGMPSHSLKPGEHPLATQMPVAQLAIA
jgi:hypothetical protein